MKHLMFLTAALGALTLSACNSTATPTVAAGSRPEAVTPANLTLPAGGRMVTEHGKPERVLVKWTRIPSYSDIDRVAAGNPEYAQFLRDSWRKFDAVVPARAPVADGAPLQPLDTGYCYVSVGTFTNLPLNNTVSGEYESQCSATGNATIVSANHTLLVQNNTTLASNSASRSSTNGNIRYLGAPVRMSYGGHLYCARGYHSARTADGGTFSHDTYWQCDYWNS